VVSLPTHVRDGKAITKIEEGIARENTRSSADLDKRTNNAALTRQMYFIEASLPDDRNWRSCGERLKRTLVPGRLLRSYVTYNNAYFRSALYFGYEHYLLNTMASQILVAKE